MNKIQMEQQIKIAKEGIEVLDKWTESLDTEALEEKRELIEKAKNYCKDCLEASQIIIEALEATEPKKDEPKKDEPKKEENRSADELLLKRKKNLLSNLARRLLRMI